MRKVLFTLLAAWCCGCSLTENGGESCTVADAALAGCLLEACDEDGDGRITGWEAARLERLDCPRRAIASMQGIDRFPRLRRLDCSGNALQRLDLSGNHSLRVLDCRDNPALSEVILAAGTRPAVLHDAHTRLTYR